MKIATNIRLLAGNPAQRVQRRGREISSFIIFYLFDNKQVI